MRASDESKAGQAAPHAQSPAAVLAGLEASPQGPSAGEARDRLARHGRNALPRAAMPTLPAVFLSQFKSPLIYVLLAAVLVSLLIGEWTDAAFIFAVLLVNAVIGACQEYGAERFAQALQRLVTLRAHVLRDGETCEVDAEELVPGDVVLFEPGAKVPADVRLLESHHLALDESLLTGESLAVGKTADATLGAETPLAERTTMAFAGSLVTSGRGRGVVVATALGTELGRIAASLRRCWARTSPGRRCWCAWSASRASSRWPWAWRRCSWAPSSSRAARHWPTSSCSPWRWRCRPSPRVCRWR